MQRGVEVSLQVAVFEHFAGGVGEDLDVEDAVDAEMFADGIAGEGLPVKGVVLPVHDDLGIEELDGGEVFAHLGGDEV